MRQAELFGTLLVPTDFSEESYGAFQWACQLADGVDAAVIVLHVIDSKAVLQVDSLGLADEGQAETRMREHAEVKMSRFKESPRAELEVDTIVSVGTPFLDIIRKSEEFAVDAIVMNKRGTREISEQLLFGSTAEKVLRGSRRPVIVGPFDLGSVNG